MLSYPTPPLCHGADQTLMARIGNIVFSAGIFEREADGLRVWVDAPMPNDFAREQSLAMFDLVLGLLRAWRPNAGELRSEDPIFLAPGGVHDDAGNAWALAQPAVGRATVAGEVERFAENARKAIESSRNLRDALLLNGRPRRTGADYYMIHEYAEMEFQDEKGIRDALGVSVKAQGRLTQSACNLSPFEGGRHARQQGPALMTLAEQREFIADFLRRWIAFAA